jgi:lipopolysaccharide transport protein LptA
MRCWVISLIMGGTLLCLGVDGYGQVQKKGGEKSLSKDCQESAAALHVTAERMTFDQRIQTFIFEENVRVDQCNMTVTCDHLQVTNDTRGENVERIIATGHVHFQQGTRHVVAERAEYFAVEQRLVLTGHPRAWDTQEGNEMMGEEIVVYLQDENMVVKRARVLFHPRKTMSKTP